MTDEKKDIRAARKRASRLAKVLTTASEDFKALAGLPLGVERDELHRAVGLLSAAAMPWLRASFGTKRKPKRSFSVTDGWVGG